MSVTKVRGRSKATILLAGLFLTATGMAVAQQRTSYFRFMSTFSTNQPEGEKLPVPLPPSSVESKLDFGNPGGITDLKLRTLVGEPVSMEFGTIGGVAPIVWLPGPPMPPGLRYEGGVVWGTPTAPAKGIESISAKDSTGEVARGRIDFDIVNPEVVISRLKPIVRMGARYEGLIASNVATPSYTVRGLPGSAVGPADANARAELGGSPQGIGTFPFSVDVKRPGTQIFGTTSGQVVVANQLAIAFSPSSIPAVAGPVEITATPLNVIGSATLTAIGDGAALQLRGLRYENGKLKGVLGTGAATSLTLKLVDSADQSSVTATIPVPAINPGESAIVIGPLRPGDVGGVIRTDIPDPVCTVLQTVPGIQVSADCVISGAAGQPGDYVLSVSISPRSGGGVPVIVSSPVRINPTLVAGPSQPSFSGYPGGSVNLTVNTSGIVGTPSFQLVGITPEQLADAGLVFNPVTGAITGTLNPGVSITIEVKVTDSEDGKSTSARFIVVSAPATVSTDAHAVNLRSGDVRVFSATTNIVNAVFTLLDAPNSVTIDEKTGIITYTAPDVTEQTEMPGFAIRVANAERPNVFKQATVTSLGVVRPKLGLIIAESTEGRGNVNLEIPFQFAGVSGTAEVKLASGSLPPGMSVKTTSISGKPNAAPATYRPVLRLTDSSDGRVFDMPTTIIIGPALDIAFSGPVSPIGKGTVGQPFGVTATAQNAVGTVTFENVPTAASPGLLTQAGLSMTAQGVISGPPTSPLTSTVNIRMTEVVGGVSNVIDRDLSLAIGAVQNASTAYPVVTNAGVDVTAEIYDESTSTVTNVSPGNHLLYTFSEPVTVNGIYLTTNAGAGYPHIVRNVTTGQTFNISKSGNGQYSFTQSTSDKWEVYYGSSSTIAFWTARLTFGGSAQIAPSFTAPALAASSYVVKGTAISAMAPSAILNATAPQFWTTSGTVPPGLSVNSTTGVISGTPSEVGSFDFSLALTDARGIKSVVAPLKLQVMTDDLASAEFPTISGTLPDAEDALAALYDGYSDTTFNFATGQTLTYTFSKPVMASQLVVMAQSGNWWISAIDENRTFYEDTSVGYGAFTIAAGPPAGVSKVWTVRHIQGGSVPGAALAGGGGRPVAPYLTYGSTALASFAGSKDVPLTITPTAKATGSLNGVALTGTYRVIEGILPENITIDPATGVISGAPSKVEEKTVKVAFVTTIPGVRSYARSIKITVNPAENADTIIPVVTGTGWIDPDKAGAPIAAADITGYAYRQASYGTYFNVPAGQKVVYTFPTETTVNYFNTQRSGSYTIVNEDTGQTVFNGAANLGLNAVTPSYGKVYSIRTAAAYTLGYLKLGSGAATAPSAYFTSNSQSLRSLTIGTKQAFAEGLAVTGVGTVTASLTGAPGTVSYDAVGKKLVGSVDDPGEFQIDIRITDSRGLTSAPIRMNLSVIPSENANSIVPTVSATGLIDVNRGNVIIAPEDVRGYAYGQNGVGPMFLLPATQKVYYTFDSPTTVQSFSTYRAGYYTVMNEDTGQTVFSANAVASTNSVTQSYGRVFSIRSNAAQSLAWLKLGSGSVSAPTAYFTPSQAPVRSIYPLSGQTFTELIGVLGLGSHTATLTGAPSGIQYDPSTKRIGGTPSQIGTYEIDIRITDTSGLTSAPIRLNMNVLPATTAATEIPVISATLTDPDRGNQQIAAGDLVGYLYDASLTSSRFNLATGQTVKMTFDKEVTASSLHLSGAASFTIVNDDTGVQVYSGSIGSGGGYVTFNPTSGKSFTITSTAQTILGYLRLGYGSGVPSVPHFAAANLPLNVFLGGAANLDLGLANATSPVTYAHTGLPSWLSINEAGKIVGTAENVGTASVTIRATDARGYSTAPATVPVSVSPTQTARNSVAVASAYAGMDSNDVSAALMDNSLTTSVSIAPGGTITFTYPGPTLASGFYLGVNGSARSIEISDDTDTVRYSGTIGTAYANWSSDTGLTGPNGGRAVISTTFKVKNTSTQSLSLYYLIPQYGSALDAAVIYPYITANASYTGIPRTGAYSVVPSAAFAVGGVTWSVSGALPTGFYPNPTSGVLTRSAADATASAPETRAVTLSLTDSRGLAAMKVPITLQVN